MTPRVIILSDGHANEGIVDPAELREHAGELRVRGVLTTCLGIGDGYDEQLLRGIAESGGGRLHDAELTSEISSVLLGELDDIFGTVVEDAKVSVTVPYGAQIDVLGIRNAERHADSLVVSLGPIQNEVDRTVVFKVVCPRAGAGAEFAFEVSATGRDLYNDAGLEIRPVWARLAAADGAGNSAQSRDAELARTVARTWSADIVATAARMNRDGAYREAEAYLERELHHFRRYVDGLDGASQMIRELELLARRVGQEFSPRMRKEMVLQSSLAMESRIDRRGASKAAWSARLERGD